MLRALPITTPPPPCIPRRAEEIRSVAHLRLANPVVPCDVAKAPNGHVTFSKAQANAPELNRIPDEDG